MDSKKSKEEMEDLSRYVKLLEARARKCGVPSADAEDIAQEALIKAYMREKPLPECSEQRKALLLAIVKFEVLTYYAEKKRAAIRAEQARVGATVIGFGYTRDKSAVIEARQQLELVFSHIPPQLLEVYIEKVLDELTLAEVAEVLGMNVNTAQSYWQRALSRLEAEMEKLEKPGRRRFRGFLVFVGISGVLGAARNASAMANWLIRFFRDVTRLGKLPLRALSGVATSAALVTYSPGLTSASADEIAAADNSAMVANAPNAGDSSLPVPAGPVESIVPKVIATEVVPRAIRKSKPKRQTENGKSSDGLLSNAKAALQHGDPERAIALLNQIPPLDSKSDDAVLVGNLRAAAERAMEKRK